MASPVFTAAGMVIEAVVLLAAMAFEALKTIDNSLEAANRARPANLT
jgi:hypothetical protein